MLKKSKSTVKDGKSFLAKKKTRNINREEIAGKFNCNMLVFSILIFSKRIWISTNINVGY
jgi:hypothetical protein